MIGCSTTWLCNEISAVLLLPATLTRSLSLSLSLTDTNLLIKGALELESYTMSLMVDL